MQTEVANSATAPCYFQDVDRKTNASLFWKRLVDYICSCASKASLFLQWFQWHGTFGKTAAFIYKTASYFAPVVHTKHPSLVKTGQLNWVVVMYSPQQGPLLITFQRWASVLLAAALRYLTYHHRCCFSTCYLPFSPLASACPYLLLLPTPHSFPFPLFTYPPL